MTRKIRKDDELRRPVPTKSRYDNAKGDKRFVDVGSFSYSVSAVLRVCSFTDTAQRETESVSELYSSPLRLHSRDHPLGGISIMFTKSHILD